MIRPIFLGSVESNPCPNLRCLRIFMCVHRCLSIRLADILGCNVTELIFVGLPENLFDCPPACMCAECPHPEERDACKLLH